MDVDPDARQGSTPEADVTTEETVVEVERIRERDSEESGAEEDPQTPEVVVMEEVEDSEANTEVEDQTIYEAKEFENRHDREMDIPMEETVEPEPMDVQGDRDEVISASDGAEDVAIIEDVEDASGEGGGRIDGGSDYGGALQEDEPERDELPSRKISENVESEEGKVTTAAVSSGEGTVSMWDEDEDVAGFSSRSARQVRKMRAEEEMIGEFSSSSIRSSSRYEASSSSFSSRLSSSHSTSVRESYSSVEASSSSLSASLAAERRRLELEEVASEAFSTGDYSRSLDARLPVATERRKLIESEESDTRVSGYRKTAEERRQDALSYSSHDEEESVTSKRSADVASLKDEVKVESALKDEEKVRGKTDKEEVVEEAVVEEVKEGSAAEEQEKAAAEETEVFQEVVEKQEEKVEEKEEAVVEKEEKLQEKEDVVVAKEEAAVKAAEGTVTAKKEEKVEGRKAAVADEEVEDVFAGRSDDVAATTAARVPKPSERKKISVSSEQEEVSVSRKISSSREEVSRSESKSSSASREKSQVESRERSLNIPEDRRIPLSKSESKSLVVPDISEGEPKFLKTLRGVHIGPGDTARFDCTLEDRGHNSVTWLRNNHPFEDRLADRVVIREDKNMFSLIIKNCHEEDSGLITARATNASGICSISTAQLIVDENQHPEESPAPEGSEPRFIVSLKDTELVEKTHARFMIKVVGEPKPKLTFLKDGVKLVEDDRVRVLQEGATSYDFEITETLSQDQGRYECIAENVHGMASTTGEVKVTAEKDIWKSVKSIDKILAPGEEPEFEWFRDGERFEPEERFKVLLKDDEDTLALIFKHVRPEDAGLYTCVASTSCGKMSCSAELTVQGAVHHLLREPVPPEILLHLTDTEVSTGGSAMLELKVTGYPKPDCSWYKDGQLITAGGRYRFLYEDDTSIALIIKNVEKGDGGKYVVKAKNEIGEAETSGNLIVRAPPRFKKKTSDVACMTDAPMKYNVEVEGNPAPEIKWYKDGQLIMESERVKVVKESDESFTLLIQRVMLEDSGSYSIVASNEIGQMSDFFQLTANSPPQFHRRLKKLVEAREEDDIEFEVDVRGNPAPKIKWFHKDKELTESGNVAFSKKGDSIHVLKIKGISRKDMGKITCRVSNEHGEDEDTSQLKVFCKPEVQKPLTDMTVKEGDKVDLECGIEAYPEPKITWYHEETEITEVKKEYTKLSKEGIYNLIMEEIQEEMAGKYLIQAWNDLGKAESSGNVNVKFRPKVITSLENCERDETQEAVFTVRAKGNPAPSAEWFDNKGKKIAPSDHYKIEEDGDSYTLRIPDTTGADSGEYSVILTNEIDILEIKATLLVNKPKERSDKRTSDEERKEKEVTKQQEKKKEVKEELSEEESSESSDESTEEFVSPPPIKRVIPEKKREDSFPRDEAAAEQEVPKKKVFDDEKDEDWPPRDEAPAEQEVPKKKVFDDEKGEDWPPRDEAAAEQEVPKKKVFDDEKDENWPPRDEAAAEQEVPKNKVFDDEKDEDWPPRDEEVVEQEVPKKKVFDDEKDEDWPPRDEAAAEQEVPKKKVFDDEKDEDWPPRDEVAAEQEVPKKKVFDDEKNEDWPPRDEAAAEQEVPKEKAFDDEKDEEWLPRDEAAVEKEVPKKTFFGDEKDEGWLSRNGEKEVPKKKAFGDEKGEGWPIDDEAVTEKPEVEDRKPQPKAKASQEEVPVPEVNEELPAKKVGGVDQTKPSQPVEEKPSSLSAEENADEKTVGEAVKEVIGKTVKEKASDEKKKEEVVETPKKKDSMENKKPPPSQQPAKVPEDVKDKKAKEEPTVAPAKAEVKKQEIKKETSRSSEECKTIALTKPACDLEFDKINTTLTAVVPAKTSEDNKGQFLDPNVEASNCSRKRFVPQLLSGEEDFAAIEETVETFTLVDEDGVEAEPFYECEGDGLVHHVDIGDICSTFDPCDLLMEDVSSPTVIIPREDASWLEKEIRSRSHLSSFVRLQSVDIESLDLHDPGTSQVRDEGAFVIEEKVTKMKVTRMKRNNDLIEVIKNDSAVECDDSSESIEGLEDFVELSDVFLESVSPQEVEFPVEIIPLDEVFSAEKRTRTKSGAMKKVHFEGLSDVQIKDLDEAPLNTPHDAGELERKPNSAVSTLVSSEGYEQIQTMAVNDHVLSLKDIARKVGSSVVSSEALETSMIASVETDNAKVSVATEKVTAPSTTSPSCETETMKSLTETNMIQSEEMTQISASIQTQNATSSVTSFKAEKTVSSVTSFETERERTFETSTESCKTTLSETEKVSASVISLETQRDVTSLETDKAAYSYEKASISSVETGERALSAVTSGVTVSETAHVASLEGNATISTYSFETEKASISSVETEERALSAVTSGVTVSETANVASLEDQTKLGNATLSAAPFETEKAASVVTSCETDKALLSVSEEDKGASVIAVHEVGRRISEDIPGSVEYPSEVCLQGMPSTKEDLDAICDEKPVKEQEELPIPVEDVLCPEQVEFDVHGSEGTSNIEETSSYGSEEHSFDFEESVEKAKDSSDKINIDKMEIESLDEVCAVKLDEIDLPEDPSFVKVEEEELVEEALSHDDISDHTLERASSSETVVSENLAELGSSLDIDERSSRDSVDLTAEPELEEVEPEMFSVLDPQNAKIITEVDTKVVPVCEEPLTVSTKEVEGLAANASVEVTQEITSVVDFGINKGVRFEPAVAHAVEIHLPHLSPESPFSSEEFSEFASPLSQSLPVELRPSVQEGLSSATTSASPKILGGQINCDAIETDDYVLEFKGSGVPNPKVVWTKNGEEVKDTDRIKAVQEDDTFKLILNNIQMEDDGEYECLLENRLGSESIKGVVKVTKIDEVLHPKIKPWLENQVIIEDDCGTLSCKVYGSPAPEITWFKDDQEIENSDHIRAYSEHDDPREKRLKLNVVKEQDMGQYKIVARNVHGEVDSEAHVEITWKPKIKGLRHLDKVTVDYGDDVSIAATVSANPKSDVVWKHNGVELPKGDAVRGYEEDGDTYTLVIKAADYRRDDGKYTLHARNELGETVDGFELEVHTIKPYFKLALENASAPLGAPLTLLARIDGLPKPTATWYKEGVEVTESTPGITLNFEEGFHELKIERIEEAFLCKYTIVGTSDVGECTSSGEVTCDTHPPLIEGQLRKVNRLHEGDTLTLEAVAKGSPIPVITWYKDGVPIEPDGERIVATSQPDGTQVLVVKNVTPDDEGEYKLAARNKFGEVSSPSHVEVKVHYTAVRTQRRTRGAPDKPHFVKELGDVTAVLGMPVDLVAQVKGCPKPRTKWFKDGKPIHGGFLNDPDGTTTFHISWPKVEDVGTYSIVATNDSGEAESVGTLKLEGAAGPPKILAPMKNARAVEGYPVKLETTVSGHPLPEIVWMKGDDIIEPDGVRVRAVVEPNGTVALIIDEAQLKDTGDYTLIAKNPQGEDKRRVKLVVLDKFKDGEAEAEPYFKTPLKDVTIPEGSELRLIADIIGNPLPDVVWKRNGEPIEKGGDVKVAFDGKKVGLIAPCVRRADAGEFECCLKNPLGEAKSSCQVSIEKTYEAPTWTQKFSDQQQMPGFDANLAGRVSGVPCPDVTWSKDGEVLREGARIKMKRDGELAVLFIQDCRESDSGFYEAVAKNCEGTADCSASLTVVPKVDHGPKAEPPSFLKKIGDCEVYERMPARFTACVMGNPEPEFEWFKDDVKLQPSDRIHFEKEGSGLLRLAIDHATVEDAGRYKLNIWNEHGNAWCEAELSFDGLDASRPKPRGDGDHWVLEPLKDAPIISRMTDRQLKLSWRPSVPHGPRDPVTYKVEIKDEPGGDWKPLRSGVMSCAMEVRNLLPHADYSFRVSVESKYGVSDPSPVATTSRGVLAPRPAAERLHLEPGTEFNPEISPYFPADFDLERPPHDKYTAAPKFLRQQFDKQYGIKNQPTNIRWFVYGYPKPEVKWFFNDQPVEMGGRFSFSYTRNGCATLFINGMLERDVGLYECIATNEHGKASQRVDVALAEHPKFLTQLTETHALARDSFRLECHLVGVPYPDVKWFKDWQPIAASNRIKILWNEPDRCTLVVNDCIAKDAGLYSCTGTNMAGTASTSCSVYIEEDVKDYDWKTYKKPYPFSSYKRPLRDLYDLGKELGRGTQGIIQHAVERSTGQTFAAKSMKGFDHFHDMENEAKIMQGLTHPHLCRLFDLFDEGDVMTLVTDIGGGGDLFEWISNQPHVNEYEIAHFIRQVLEGLKHMHDREIAHLGLTPGDIFLTRPNGDEIKIGDFGLAKTLHGGRLIALDYGMPEFVAPEIASKSDNVGLPADMWAVGLMTYLYLSGLSPFRGRDDVETLENVKGGQYSLDIDPFPNLSPECRDFIKKMLVYDPKGRLNVAAALEHPWLKLPMPKEPFLIPTDRHKMAFRDYRDWNDNAKCRDQFRRNPLSGAYLHPSRMVYPPRVPDIPYETPDYDARHVSPLDTSIPMPDSESHYQQGPDTYLLQLRDSDFPSRLRRYMKVAADRSPSFALRLRQDNYMANPTVRERRKFRDISDEEVKEEKSGAGEGRYRLKYEPGYNLDAKKDAEAYLETKRSGKAPFFREKLQPRALVEDEEAVLSCLALGDPKPVVHFFRNGFLVTPNNRILIETDSDGRTLLKFTAAEPGDAGIFRAVARNKLGEVACFTRFLIGHKPACPDIPQVTNVSDTEVLLKWTAPHEDGVSRVLCYALEAKEDEEDSEWQLVAENIDHEFYCVRNLKPETPFIFRLCARNKYGWGPKSMTSDVVTTKEAGAPKIQVSLAMKHQQELTESGLPVHDLSDTVAKRDYSVETQPIPLQNINPAEKYNFMAEISRGRFSVIVKCSERSSGTLRAAKFVSKKFEEESMLEREYENLKHLCHERIASLVEAFDMGPACCFILEKLHGIDVLTYLANRNEYTEETVAQIISQVLDGLQYLHWRGLVHLDLQPDNIVMTSPRLVDIKLVDFGSAQHVTRRGLPVETTGLSDFTSPEVLKGEDAVVESDIWSVGVLTYLFLSGVSPFCGATKEETIANVNYVRYVFEPLYRGITGEAERFLMAVFKRHPTKRPTADECLENRWLQCTDHMLRKRERAVFSTDKIKSYEEEYHAHRATNAVQTEDLAEAMGPAPSALARSATVAFDTQTPF